MSLSTLLARISVARVYSIHLFLILLCDFIVYAYRDIWPLLTTYAAVAVPLLVLRQYVPVDPSNPQSEPNPEQTASALSFLTFSFLDPYIFIANRQKSLEFEQFPALCDYDRARDLVKRSFKHLDRFSGAPAQHMFIALLRTFCMSSLFVAAVLELIVSGSMGCRNASHPP